MGVTAPAVIDLFAGPGGWDLGARYAGLPDPLGVEWGDDEVATRQAAGLRTLHADVGAIDPGGVLAEHFPGQHLDGLIASPPCQAWSLAGKGRGRIHDVGLCNTAADRMRDGMDERATLASECQDPRSILVVEPLRWVLDLAPTWTAWEQVEPVLPYWERCAEHLRAAGYTAWTGIVRAEQYGVPQTRRRAILLAARDERPVDRPPPTHRRFVPPRRLDESIPTLFPIDDLAEPKIHPGEHDLLPWVSMAQAVGFADETLVGFPRRSETDSNRAGAATVTFDGVDYRERDLRSGGQPAITAGHDSAERVIVPTHMDPRQNGAQPRSVQDPAATVTGTGNAKGVNVWLSKPDDRSMDGAQRVTVQQAAALQTFPTDWPWQGSKTSQHRQIGNAVPPLLAAHVLRAIATTTGSDQ